MNMAYHFIIYACAIHSQKLKLLIVVPYIIALLIVVPYIPRFTLAMQQLK